MDQLARALTQARDQVFAGRVSMARSNAIRRRRKQTGDDLEVVVRT